MSPKPGLLSLGREWEQLVLPVGLHILVFVFLILLVCEVDATV